MKQRLSGLDRSRLFLFASYCAHRAVARLAPAQASLLEGIVATAWDANLDLSEARIKAVAAANARFDHAYPIDEDTPMSLTNAASAVGCMVDIVATEKDPLPRAANAAQFLLDMVDDDRALVASEAEAFERALVIIEATASVPDVRLLAERPS